VIKVLVVDDSALVRKLFSRVLSESPDFTVGVARNGLEALAQLEAFEPDVITLDVQMPHMDGLQCLDRIMVQRPCPVVMVSTVTDEGADATLEALRLGAVDFVPKPTGAVSLRMQEFGPTLMEKVRTAAAARLSASHRLRERVQFKMGGTTPTRRAKLSAQTIEVREAPRPTGDGLVLVGTSTGGPPALEALLTPLPRDFPWPILVAQHMPAGFTGPLAKRLSGLCELTVTEVARPSRLEAGCVYIGRGDADLVVSRRPAGLIAMTVPSDRDYPWHPSTDRLVRSAMEHLPATQLIGVLMTGMGTDGAEAMTIMRAKGGATVAEAEETAVVWGMPGELVRTGGASYVVPLPGIAQRLKRLVPHAVRS
jgi:two-component system, chemotaxis family, protein-glutamate methylesterase/glutaminase